MPQRLVAIGARPRKPLHIPEIRPRLRSFGFVLIRIPRYGGRIQITGYPVLAMIAGKERRHLDSAVVQRLKDVFRSGPPGPDRPHAPPPPSPHSRTTPPPTLAPPQIGNT